MIVAVVAAFFGFIAVVIAITQGQSDDPGVTPRSSSETTARQIQPPETSQSTESAPDEPAERTGEEPGSDVPDSIRVNFDDLVSLSIGKRVGPSKWQLKQWGDSPTAAVSVAWESRDSNNVLIEGSDCEMSISVSGPEDPPSLRSAECSQGHRSYFRNDSVSFRLTVPGHYEVTVEDGITGTSGTATFDIVS